MIKFWRVFDDCVYGRIKCFVRSIVQWPKPSKDLFLIKLDGFSRIRFRGIRNGRAVRVGHYLFSRSIEGDGTVTNMLWTLVRFWLGWNWRRTNIPQTLVRISSACDHPLFRLIADSGYQ